MSKEAGPTPRPPPPVVVNSMRRSPMLIPIGALALGAGVAMGYGLRLGDYTIGFDFSNSNKKKEPAIDPKLMEQLSNQDKKVVMLETQLKLLRDDLREQKTRQQQQQQEQINQARAAPVARTTGDVFELSQVIEANNLANLTRYKQELHEQRQALVRDHMLKVEGAILKVENKYRPIINKIRELESHLETQRQVQQKEAPARLLWISCQSLLDKMRHSPQEPLEKDPSYDVLKQFAANDNPLAISIIDSIPAKALKEGVQSEDLLVKRFSKLERICKRVSMVGATGGGLGKYLMSYLQSLFIIDNVKVSEDEVSGRQLVDPTSWTTFDILARVRYCLESNNLEQAVRYANQLQGLARVVARDWIRDARTHLITRQAFSTLSTHAEAIAVDSVQQNFAANE